MRFIEALPETTMLVLDEAYGETGPASAIPPLDLDRPNVIRTRTFSKAYGLAGLRCGYAIGETETIRAFDKVRNHFGVNKMAQVAAQAALADQAYLRSVVERVAAGRERIAADRPQQRPCPDRLGDQFRYYRLRHRRRLRAEGAAGIDRPRRFREETDGAGARPLHPHQRRTRAGDGDLRSGTAGSAGGSARQLSCSASNGKRTTCSKSQDQRPRPGRLFSCMDARRGRKARPRRLGPQRARRLGDGADRGTACGCGRDDRAAAPGAAGGGGVERRLSRKRIRRKWRRGLVFGIDRRLSPPLRRGWRRSRRSGCLRGTVGVRHVCAERGRTDPPGTSCHLPSRGRLPAAGKS